MVVVQEEAPVAVEELLVAKRVAALAEAAASLVESVGEEGVEAEKAAVVAGMEAALEHSDRCVPKIADALQNEERVPLVERRYAVRRARVCGPLALRLAIVPYVQYCDR